MASPTTIVCWGLLVGSFAGLAAAAEPRAWPYESSLGRFQIHADFDVSAAAPLAPELSELAADVRQVLAIEGGEQTVHVVLFASSAEYHRYMHNYFPQLPARRALYIQDRGPGMLFAHWHSDVAADLRHEVTHALLNDGGGPLPLWLDEGLAEYFEIERERRFRQADYLPDVAQRVGQGLIPQLEQLEQIEDLPQFTTDHYRDSWSWVHFLIHRSPETRQLLVAYVASLRSGVSQLPLSRQLRQLSADVRGDYQAHFAELATELRLRRN